MPFRPRPNPTWNVPVMVPADSPWFGEGWPWCVDCEDCPYAVAITMASATKTTITYKEETGLPPDVGEWDPEGSGAANFTDYTGEPGPIASISVDARRKLGLRFTAGPIGAPFPTSQRITLEYSIVEYAPGVIISQTPQTANFTLTPGTAEFDTGWITLTAPGTSGRSRNVAGALVHPLVAVIATVAGARRFKRGFRAYTAGVFPPVVYAREVTTGSRGACAASGITARDYTGSQRINADGSIEGARSADAYADGYYSGERGSHMPYYDSGHTFQTATPTSLVRDLTHSCEGTPVPGEVTLALSEPVATSSIVTAVEGAIAAALAADAPTEIFEPQTISWFDAPEDETVYDRAEAKWRLGLYLGADMATPDDEPVVTAAVDVVVTDVATGLETRTTVTARITISFFDDWIESSPRVARATRGQRIRLENFRCTGEKKITGTFRIVARSNAVPVV